MSSAGIHYFYYSTEQLWLESSHPRNWQVLFFILSNIIHGILAAALCACFAYFPHLLFDYTDTHPALLSTHRAWLHNKLLASYGRVLAVSASLCGFAAVLALHCVELLHYYAAQLDGYIVTHHALTIVLIAWIFLDRFFNGYSLLPLLMHCLVMLNPYGREITWLYAIYAQSYAQVVAVGVWLMLARNTPSDATQRRDHAFLALLIAVHVLNIVNMGNSDTLVRDLRSTAFAMIAFFALWAALAYRYTLCKRNSSAINDQRAASQTGPETKARASKPRRRAWTQ